MEKNIDSLLPSDEVDKMRREIDTLRRKQGLVDTDNSDERAAISSLSKSINSLTRIFKDASEDLKMDTHDAVLVAQKLDKILERLDKVEVQNEKIAKGIVAIADMIEDMQVGQRRPMPQQQMQYSQQGIPSPQPQMMQGGMPKPLPTYDIPPQEEKKKGFMSFKI
jgi:chromosome segregation ATPase